MSPNSRTREQARGFMNVVKEIQRINLKEAALNIGSDASWHAKYKDSPYVYIGGLPYDLTEGDIIQVFSQYVTLSRVFAL